ncbi:MAG: DNA-directed RNA polymerase subunit alpha [Desulfobulbus sp.]|jgi:DNA-directed RNA polymerase subunit alpha|nr:MAG: DNA-directed RNA polymerase subunit alpha [Desulfobulbus sp.]
MAQETREDIPFYKNWHDLIQPERIEVNKQSHTDRFGKFVCQPFERGFATTIGNSLRRILLSSIRGAAITSVKVEGAQHEFTTINGIHEDLADIILNFKQVRLKLNHGDSQTVVIEKKGPGVVTAGDINGAPYVDVMNPDQHICTITADTTFRAELEVKWGKGYRPAEQNKTEDQPIGVIPIDSAFSPIKRIQYVVSQARVGQQTDYDRLTFEIETDGSVTPENALAFAAKILKEQMTIFINFDEEKAEPEIGEGGDDGMTKYPPFLDKDVDDLELSVRSANCLKNAKIQFIGQLVQRTDAEMLKTKNFGRKSLNEIRALLSEHSLSLGMNIEGWLPPDQREENGEDI